MSFETIDNGRGGEDELWTCDKCKHQIMFVGTGGDSPAECPKCLENEYAADAERERDDAAKDNTGEQDDIHDTEV